jgi:hypothetical protein
VRGQDLSGAGAHDVVMIFVAADGAVHGGVVFALCELHMGNLLRGGQRPEGESQ